MRINKDTVGGTLLVAFLVCIVCSVLLAGAVVSLKDVQQRNKALDRQRNILVAAGLFDPSKHKSADIVRLFSAFEVVLVDLETGQVASPETLAALGVNPDTYDQRAATKNPKLSKALPGEQDIALVRRQARFAQVYLLRENGAVKSVVLPVSGYGLWSTLHGFLVLEGDGNTVVGLGFYEHAETPGLGGEVDNPKWKALWPGKQVYAEGGEPAITMVKGKVDASSPQAIHQVDALSGATLTSKGVENLIRFWTGEHGYAGFLGHVRAGEI